MALIGNASLYLSPARRECVSAIVGIYYFDGRPIDHLNLEEMMARVAHRGADAVGVWGQGEIGLGNRLLWTTPESLKEKLPRLNQAGELVLTADARLDNRAELVALLGLTDGPHCDITDGQLILAAYEKWGEHCPEKLLGDFAFALWDKRRQRLFCARDHFGIKPFYYHFSGQSFAFASEIKALLCLPEVENCLNEIRIADYLTSMFDDPAITFYQNIFRLPPHHGLMVSREGMRLQSYWSLNPGPGLQLNSDEAYAEAFRELFTEAVRCRLRSAFPVASLLSGGLDSSSVTCVARQQLSPNGQGGWPTFSAIFDEVTECDERPFIQAVLTQGGFEPHYVQGDKQSPLADLDHIFWHQDEAFHAPNLFMTWSLYRAAGGQNVRILLDGFDGDTTVSHGFGYLKELAQARRWLALALELRGLDETFNTSSWGLMWRYLQVYELEPALARSQVGYRAWQALLRRFAPGDSQAAGRPIPKGHAVWNTTLKPEFVQRIGLVERYQTWQKNQPGAAPNEREGHYRAISQGLHPFALEVLDKAAAAFSIEPRYPFWDKRLVEFCLTLPPEQKLHRGWSRLVLRRAMTHILPKKVQWRRDKSNFLPSFTHGMLIFAQKRLDEIMRQDLALIETYVDITALHQAYHRFVSQTSQEKERDLFMIWQSVSLVLWLKHLRNNPDNNSKPSTKKGSNYEERKTGET